MEAQEALNQLMVETAARAAQNGHQLALWRFDDPPDVRWLAAPCTFCNAAVVINLTSGVALAEGASLALRFHCPQAST